jgi:16S rRNA (guanine527-N7)-methyltransferase
MNRELLQPYQLSDEQEQQLEELVSVFLKKNQELNLSSLRDEASVVMKHVIDSLLILPYGWLQNGQKVMDLGTGGGFPGLVLAIVFPESSLTLVDATEKKVRAVRQMAKELGLQNVRCVAGRAEELGHQEDLREAFDVVVARAVAGFSTLLEYSLPFVKPQGRFIAYQGPDLIDAWQGFQGVAKKLSSEMMSCQSSVLPDENHSQRCFIEVLKIGTLSPAFPRRIGIPKKTPLEG